MDKQPQPPELGVCGDVCIALAQTACLPGDEIVGIVHLRIDEPIRHAQLHVSLHGEQLLRWKQRDGQTAARRSNAIKHLERMTILSPCGTAFEEGEHEYPFSFRLPTSNLPASLRYARTGVDSLEAVKVTVKYAVDVVLVVDNSPQENLTSTTRLTVKQSVAQATAENAQSITVQQDHVVKKLGFIPSGACTTNMQLATDTFSGDSTIVAHVTLELSKTTSKLKYVTLVLYEDVAIHRQKGRDPKHSSRVVGLRRFEASALRVADNRLAKTLHLPITPNDLYKFDAVLPTLELAFLSINYRVALECHFAAASTTEISVPVRIVANRPRYDNCVDQVDLQLM